MPPVDFVQLMSVVNKHKIRMAKLHLSRLLESRVKVAYLLSKSDLHREREGERDPHGSGHLPVTTLALATG